MRMSAVAVRPAACRDRLSWLAVAVAALVIATAVPARAEVTLTFGVYTSDKPTSMVRQFQPALTALEAKLSSILGEAAHINLQVARGYEAGLSHLVSGHVDFARFGPASYINAKRANPDLSILAVESNGGEKVFYGIIAVREDSDIHDISQLAGRTFAFGDENSTIGRYLSQLYLLEHGIMSNTLGSYAYLDRHDRVGTAVGLGQFDAGALKDNTFEKLVARGTPIRELARFPNITKPWIARSGLDPRVRNALAQALISLEEPVALAALGTDGFIAGDDSDYDIIRKAIERNSEFFATGTAQLTR